jgi:hypothetical protein
MSAGSSSPKRAWIQDFFRGRFQVDPHRPEAVQWRGIVQRFLQRPALELAGVQREHIEHLPISNDACVVGRRARKEAVRRAR